MAGLGLSLRPALKTGGHRLSARAVADGRADIAALDAVTWRMLRGDEPAVARLKPVGLTDPTPGLPLIAAAGTDTEATFAAVDEAIATLSAEDRLALGLRGLVRIPVAAYLKVPNPPAPPADLPVC